MKINKFKIVFILPFDFLFFLYDFLTFRILKKNSESSYQFLIRIYILFGGTVLQFVNFFLKHKRDESIKEYIDNANLNINIPLKNLNTILKEKGYYFQENALDKNIINNIVNKIKGIKGKYYSDQYSSNVIEDLDLVKPKAVKYAYSRNDLINISDIQELALSKELLLIAQNYLDSLPILDLVECWWSFPSKNSLNADDKAAQKWHFDMDRPKWIKIFFYLTDCQINNGPHAFIEQSHKNNGIPFSIRKKGYSRIDDSLIAKNFLLDRIKTITGGKGSIVIEDTRGLHKGEPVIEKNRLILQFQYSSSLFGAKIDKIIIPKFQTVQMKKLLEEKNKILENFGHN
jgi:ectoine hydroxylase-related dioxygenase (phytanoyl-CoA dioxygenase family)